jgi:hypothetical protein
MYGKDDLISALRMRYDAYSAEAVFEMARDRAGLANKPALDARELAAFRAALAAVGDRVTRVLEEIDRMLGAAAAPPAAKPAPVPAAATAPAPAPAAAPASTAAPAPAAAPAKAKEPTAVETTVVLKGLDVSDGEQVMMCGAFAELGDWDPERARPMARKGDEWLATVKVAPDVEISFKFLRRTKSGEVIWESGDDRRLVAAPRLDATWRATT